MGVQDSHFEPYPNKSTKNSSTMVPTSLNESPRETPFLTDHLASIPISSEPQVLRSTGKVGTMSCPSQS